MSVVVVFGSGSIDSSSVDYALAEKLGFELAARGYDIATGAYEGVMEAVLKGASLYDTKRIGISTEFYKNRQINNFVTEEIKTNDYFGRLIKLISIGDAFIALPGSSGTLFEIAAIWTLKNRNALHNKIIITVGDIWREVIEIMAFYNEELIDKFELINRVNDIDEALHLIDQHFKNGKE